VKGVFNVVISQSKYVGRALVLYMIDLYTLGLEETTIYAGTNRTRYNAAAEFGKHGAKSCAWYLVLPEKHRALTTVLRVNVFPPLDISDLGCQDRRPQQPVL
jgi:hypothetical protein